MRAMIASLPEQLAWALDADVAGPTLDAPEIVVCGMGGSGISGDVLAVVAGRRVTVHKDYGLPDWVADVRPLVVGVSYSGRTEETLDALASARALGLDVVTISTGSAIGDIGSLAHVRVPDRGLQPRAAIGYQSGALLRLMHAVGAIDDPTDQLAEAIEVVRLLLGDALDGPGMALADDIAGALAGRTPLIRVGGGVPAAAAQRWKGEIHENAKLPAAVSLLPELDHNELAGWRPDTAGWGIVALRDAADHPRVALRHDLSRDLTPAPTVAEVWSQGDSPLARLFSLTTIGDLTSLRMAERDGVDPVEIDVLITLKQRLESSP